MTGGKPAKQGPLVLKRELRAADAALAGLESKLVQAEAETAAAAQDVENMTQQVEARGEEHRLAERDAVDLGARLRQMESEIQRIESRLQEWSMQSVRNEDTQIAKRALIEQKQKEATRLEAEQIAAEVAFEERQNQLGLLRQRREVLQREGGQATTELATLEERRRGAEAAFQRIDRLFADLERRLATEAQQQAEAEAEHAQRIDENADLQALEKELTTSREAALDQVQKVTQEAHVIRERLAALDMKLKSGRTALEQSREERGYLSSGMAKLSADLEHVETSCLNDVNVDAAELRADGEVTRLTSEEMRSSPHAARTNRTNGPSEHDGAGRI